jgi:hypothetical protein
VVLSTEELFYTFPEPVPALCWRLRDLVLEVAPDARELVRPGWKLLGFDLDRYFCAVAPQRDHARLLFEHGHELADPKGKLEGRGGTQVRWLKFKNLDAIDEKLVKHFVRLAVKQQQKKR